MGDLDEVVQLDTLVDDGLSHRRAVDAGVGTNLYVVLNDHNAYLGNLLVAFLVGSEAKAVSADHRTGMNGDTVADFCAVIDGDVGIDTASVAYLHTFANVGEGTDIDILADFGRWRHESQRVNACLLRLHGSIHLHQLGDALVRVLDPDERCRDGLLQLQVLIDKDDAGLGVIDVMGVFGVREERDGSFFPFFDFCKGMDGCLFVTFHATSYIVGYLFGCKLHNVNKVL